MKTTVTNIFILIFCSHLALAEDTNFIDCVVVELYGKNVKVTSEFVQKKLLDAKISTTPVEWHETYIKRDYLIYPTFLDDYLRDGTILNYTKIALDSFVYTIDILHARFVVKVSNENWKEDIYTIDQILSGVAVINSISNLSVKEAAKFMYPSDADDSLDPAFNTFTFSPTTCPDSFN